MKGFTLIELLLVMAIVSILFALIIGNLNSLQQNTNQNASEELLLSDLKLQQLKSMSGDTGESGNFLPFGIYFGTNSYTLFRGATYNNLDSENFTIELSPNLTFTDVEFSSSQIIFAKNSGDISNFSPGNNTITITNSVTGKNSVITLNKYGAIINVQ